MGVGGGGRAAASGEGVLRAPSPSPSPAAPGHQAPAWAGRPYRSAARIVLVGHGADEQCAGYGRHRTTFRNQARRASVPVPPHLFPHLIHPPTPSPVPQPTDSAIAQATVTLTSCGAAFRSAAKGGDGVQGWRALASEMAAETARMWRRNLGRDDRIVADQGREARHPFLAEAVMQTLLALPLPLVADLRLPPGATALCAVTPQILVLRWLRPRSLDL